MDIGVVCPNTSVAFRFSTCGYDLCSSLTPFFVRTLFRYSSHGTVTEEKTRPSTLGKQNQEPHWLFESCAPSQLLHSVSIGDMRL